MLYLFYGKEDYLISKEIKKILTDNNIDNINVNTYDLETSLLSTIIDDALTISLFSDKKVLICNNSHLFTASKKSILDPDIDELDKYFDNINPGTIMIFTVSEENIDDRKKIVKKIKKIATVKDYNFSNNTLALVKDMFEDYKISSGSINLLIDRVGNNLNLLEREVDKIKLYKFDEKEILDDDIINLTNKNIDMDIFHLIDNIIIKNKEAALITYHEMLKYNEEALTILIMIANQFRIMYQSKELYKKGYTKNDISSMLDIHPFRIQKALEKGTNYDNKTILKYINDLADLDYNIKRGQVDKEIGIELFIINI